MQAWSLWIMNVSAPTDLMPEVEHDRFVSSFAPQVVIFFQHPSATQPKNTLNNETSTWLHVVFINVVLLLLFWVCGFCQSSYCAVFPLYSKITRKTFASHKLRSHLLIHHAVPIRLTVYVNVLLALLGPFITSLCLDANEVSNHRNPVFL